MDVPPDSEYTCELNEEFVKKARTELREDKSDRLAAVGALREWVLAQSQWLKTPTDTKFLLAFLRQRKFSQKAAKERLIQYWKTRAAMPEWFGNVDTKSATLEGVIRDGMYLPLPRRDKDGCFVLLIRLGRSALTSSGVDKQFSSCGALLDLALKEEMTQVCGLKVFCDFSGVTLEHVMKLKDGFAKMTQAYMRAYPLRIRCTDYYNMGAVFDIFFSMARPLVPKKINERTKTHKSMKTVYDRFDKSVFPKEYLPDDYTGPNSGTVQEIIDKYVKDMESDQSRDYIKYLSSGHFHCDERKKPADAIPTESFRSLAI